LNTLAIPGGEMLHVTWNGKGIQTLELRDALGRVALQEVNYHNNPTLDASRLSPGTYTVLARSAQGERAVSKWVKP